MARHVGLLAALLHAAQDGKLVGLATFTADDLAPKIKRYLPAKPSLRQLSQSLWYAKRKGFLATQERSGALAISLTFKGRERLLDLQRLGLTVKPPKRWDGKWRMITFDIPERRRFARDTFRQALKRIGFAKLESSLWIYPYECKKELAVIAEALLLAPHIRYFLVQHFDGDEVVAAMFGLTTDQRVAASHPSTEKPGS